VKKTVRRKVIVPCVRAAVQRTIGQFSSEGMIKPHGSRPVKIGGIYHWEGERCRDVLRRDGIPPVVSEAFPGGVGLHWLMVVRL
jgi:hypothetical protein